MAGLTDALSAVGTLMEVRGSLAAGQMQQRAYDFQAKQLDRAATAERAQASYAVEDIRRQSDFIQSRARATSASSGGGVAYDVISNLEKEGERRALTALYEGETAARGLETSADAARYSGRLARKAAGAQAFSTILDSGVSLWDKYGSSVQDWWETRGDEKANARERDPLRPMPRPY